MAEDRHGRDVFCCVEISESSQEPPGLTICLEVKISMSIHAGALHWPRRNPSVSLCPSVNVASVPVPEVDVQKEELPSLLALPGCPPPTTLGH